ncbi:hypothetical protein KP509_15G004700 [Ceratopteris richardii]|uniref:GOLD domain-containing protein n=1 Tax=Ceratopteris richardii TaxID=49495 RepID=A0A8T2T4D5_CERRI|nr:hypothetical protein KP509_15G004700 [Ceratopteris richardii]
MGMMTITRMFTVAMMVVTLFLQSAMAIEFLLSKEECFVQNVDYEGDLVHVSYVVVRTQNAWDYDVPGIDVSIEGPGNFRRDIQDQPSDKIEFTAHKSGPYKICLKNKSPYAETVDIDVHVGHIPYYDEKVKNDHVDPLMGQIARLEEAIYSVQFEQHWLYAQTERQATLNEKLGRRLIYKAVWEALALIGASILQVYLLQRLFSKKLSNSRV